MFEQLSLVTRKSCDWIYRVMIYRSVAGTPLGGAGHLGLMMRRSNIISLENFHLKQIATCENYGTVYNFETHSAGMNE